MTWLWSKLDWTGLRCSGGEDRFQNHSSKTKEENKRQEEGKRIENRGRREGGGKEMIEKIEGRKIAYCHAIPDTFLPF